MFSKSQHGRATSDLPATADSGQHTLTHGDTTLEGILIECTPRGLSDEQARTGRPGPMLRRVSCRLSPLATDGVAGCVRERPMKSRVRRSACCQRVPSEDNCSPCTEDVDPMPQVPRTRRTDPSVDPTSLSDRWLWR